MTRSQGEKEPPNTPIISLAVIGLVLTASVVLIALERVDARTEHVTLIVGLLVAQIPAMLASVYAERNHRSITNGVITKKAKEGATQAIQEQEVVTRNGPVVSAELQALQQILREVRSGKIENQQGRRADQQRREERDMPRE
jgi:hypothetical protein